METVYGRRAISQNMPCPSGLAESTDKEIASSWITIDALVRTCRVCTSISRPAWITISFAGFPGKSVTLFGRVKATALLPTGRANFGSRRADLVQVERSAVAF